MITIHENFDIRKLTTFGLPAECGRFIEYTGEDDLQKMRAEGILRDALPLGGGSNMLFTTGSFPGTVIHSTSRESLLRPQSDGSVELTLTAGYPLDEACAMAARVGLWGMENLSGIPGNIGGAAVQNVGAYGTELKDLLKSAVCFDSEVGELVRLSNGDCRYGYRDSAFKHMEYPCRLIVYAVVLRLDPNGAPNLAYSGLAKALEGRSGLTPMDVRRAIIALRNQKLPDPAKVGSAGSFFKNPVVSASEYERICARYRENMVAEDGNAQADADQLVPGHVNASGEVKLSAAWLIDHAGCKSFSVGGAALWPSQPLVIVNADGHATGADVVALEERIRRRVQSVFGIDLQPEVIHIP